MSGSESALHEIRPGSFIWQWDGVLSESQCRAIIERFEAHPEKRSGRAGADAGERPSLKRSTDLTLAGPEWAEADRWLFASLSGALRGVRHCYPYFRGRFKDQGYAVQRTREGEYYHWHVDADSAVLADRQLVAIWYLNDVPGPGGETEFLHQAVKVRPAAGRLVLFPPFWTHQHRGTTLQRGVKYIATTWIVFAQGPEVPLE